MKKTRFAGILCAFAMVGAVLTGCSSGDSGNNSGNGEDTITIGVIQFGSHSSLDNCYAGIEKGLMASEYADRITIDRQDGAFDGATCDSIAQNMVAKEYDMIFAIATPAAVSAYSAAQNSDIPVIFCAVSDPVSAGLTSSFEAGTENCIGTADVLDLQSQVNLIKALQPDVKKIGILYTTTEANSVSQLATLKEIAAAEGIEIVDQGVSGAADVPQAAASVAAQVDCINNFTDNNVVDNLLVVLQQADMANIPVYGSEVEQVKKGCIASMSIDYVALGVTTAEMGVQVLNGAKPSEMAVGTISECTPVLNTDVLDRFSIAIPGEYADAELVTTGADE